ncbi:hypothetical protein AB4114_17955 [Paenibacillus sp. 2RAB27]|uniref:hypothetical protein n=1 Tax=Paenibacillus sp. 2RAB27 TaxID=3232991 RepID=UPI003F9E7E4D
MAIKWRSRSLSLVLLVGVFIMWTLTLFAVTNAYKNSVYFGEDAYFQKRGIREGNEFHLREYSVVPSGGSAF